MGAHSVVKHVETDQDLQTAWSSLYYQARVEHGNDPYSGTFATCSGVVAVSDLMSLGEAHAVADAMFMEQDIPERSRRQMHPAYAGLNGKVHRSPRKWGEAYAIPVFALAGTKVKEKTLTVSHDVAGALGQVEMRRLVEAQITLPPHAWVGECIAISDTVRSQKTVSRATGKRRIMWILVDPQGRDVGPRVEYATEREAVAAAAVHGRQQLESGWGTLAPIEVRGVLRREDGFTTVNVNVASRRTKIKYTLHTPTTSERGGWLFFGLAAS